MAPDADAGKSSAHRSDPFAPLTSQLLPVGDGHEIYVESVGRADGIAGGLSAWRARQRLPARSSPAVRSGTLPCDPVRSARRRAKPPQGPPRAQYAAASDRGHGDDPRAIRHRALDGGRRLLGRDAGAGLCAGASRSGQRHRVARDFPRHARANSKAPSSTRCRASIPDLSDDFLGVLPRGGARDSRSMRIGAGFSIPIPPCTARSPAPGTTPNGYFPSIRPARPARSCVAEIDAAPCPRRRSWKRIISRTTASCEPNQLLAEAGKLEDIPGIIVQGRYDLLCPPATSHALAARVARRRDSLRRGRRPYAVRSRRQGRGDEGDRGSRLRDHTRGYSNNADGRKRHAADVDGHRRSRTRPNSTAGTTASISRSASRSRVSLRRGVMSPHQGAPKYLCLYSTATIEVLDSPAYAPARQPDRVVRRRSCARFKNMIRAVARITISRGQGRGAVLGIVRLRLAGGEDKLRAVLRERSIPAIWTASSRCI